MKRDAPFPPLPLPGEGVVPDLRFTFHISRFTFHTAAIAITLLLGACSTATKQTVPAPTARLPETSFPPPTTPRPASPRPGGYYLDDGPGDNPPPNLDQVPDAIPRREPLARGAMRPYNVMGQDYTPMTALQPYKATGIASWYGRRYHGKQTSSGEIYDMYAMTAAHTILPIPSYARVTNLANNKSVIVRINDRGPFHSERLIDLSYTAAYKLGVLGGGRAMVEVETIIAGVGTPPPNNIAARPARTPPGATAAAPVPSAPIVATPLPPTPAVIASQDGTPAVSSSGEQPATPAVVPVSTEASGVFLQLGAFGSRDNADGYLNRLRAQIDWLAPALHIHPKDGLFRVHAGPYANQTDARVAADRITQALGIKAMVLTR